MGYLYLVKSTADYDDVDETKELESTTPLIPAFPITGDGDCNYFIGADKHGKIRNAKVVELNIDPDKLMTRASACYPGMPPALLESYIEAMCLTACDLKKDVVYQCVVDGPRAALRDVEAREDYVLWENNEPKKYL